MTSTLAGKIAKASADLGNRLKADKRNTQGGGYMYISADKLIAEAGAVLAANGVAVFPAIIGYNVDGGESSGGKRNYIVTVNFAMTVSDGETNMECPWMGAGVDYGAMDKALYKGITSGHKYFLAKLLNIGEGNEDGEHEAPPPETQNGGAQQQTRPAAAAVANGTATGKSNGSSPANGGAPKSNGAASTANNGPADTQSPAFKACMTKGVEVFGLEWKDARPWLVERYTTKETPDNIRTSSKDLTDGELKTITGWLGEYGKGLRKSWTEYREAKRAELDAITVAGAVEDAAGAALNARAVDVADSTMAH
jgi:hypothetical protein